MKEQLSKIFHHLKSSKPRNPARFYEPCQMWGHAINVTFDGKLEGKVSTTAKVYGFQSRLPQDGDIYLMPMESGKTIVWVFHNVTYPNDPRDMFFGRLTFYGYKGEVKMPQKIDDSGVTFL